MNRLRTILLVVIVLCVIAAAALGLWIVFSSLLAWIMAQESQIGAAIIAFVGTVGVGIGAVLITQQRSKSREIAESHRPKKIKIYSNFIKTMIGLIRKHKDSDTKALENGKDIQNFFFDFTTQIVLWGSPGVLRHYAELRKQGQTPNPNPNIILIMDDMMQAMRKDIGLSNRGLSRGDLMKMFLTDPESLDTVFENPTRKQGQ